MKSKGYCSNTWTPCMLFTATSWAYASRASTSAGISQHNWGHGNTVADSIVWKTGTRNALVFGPSSRSAETALTQGMKQGWPHDTVERNTGYWSRICKRQPYPQTAPEYSERGGPDPSRQC